MNTFIKLLIWIAWPYFRTTYWIRKVLTMDTISAAFQMIPGLVGVLFQIGIVFFLVLATGVANEAFGEVWWDAFPRFICGTFAFMLLLLYCAVTIMAMGSLRANRDSWFLNKVAELRIRLIRRVRFTEDKNVVWVNLEAPPKLLYDWKVEENTGGGWVKVERLDTGTYVDGKKVVLYQPREEGPFTHIVWGETAKELLRNKKVMHSNILDVLLEYPHLVHDDLKKKQRNNSTSSVLFWATIFSADDRGRGGIKFVRGMDVESDDKLSLGGHALDSYLDSRDTVAIAEN